MVKAIAIALALALGSQCSGVRPTKNDANVEWSQS